VKIGIFHVRSLGRGKYELLSDAVVVDVVIKKTDVLGPREGFPVERKDSGVAGDKGSRFLRVWFLIRKKIESRQLIAIEPFVMQNSRKLLDRRCPKSWSDQKEEEEYVVTRCIKNCGLLPYKRNCFLRANVQENFLYQPMGKGATSVSSSASDLCQNERSRPFFWLSDRWGFHVRRVNYRAKFGDSFAFFAWFPAG
jgi:hypothetical protein